MLKAKHLIMISLVNFPGTLLEPVNQSTVVRHFECHQCSTWVKTSYQQPFEMYMIGLLAWCQYGFPMVFIGCSWSFYSISPQKCGLYWSEMFVSEDCSCFFMATSLHSWCQDVDGWKRKLEPCFSKVAGLIHVLSMVSVQLFSVFYFKPWKNPCFHPSYFPYSFLKSGSSLVLRQALRVHGVI